MRRSSPLAYLWVSGLLGGVSATMPILLQTTELHRAVADAVIIIAGMTAFGAVSAVQRFLETRGALSTVHISINESMVRTVLKVDRDVHIDGPVTERNSKEQIPPWEQSSTQLLSTDSSLALAKVRMDLERELRRIAYEKGIDVSARPISIDRLVQELVEEGCLDREFLVAFRDILPALNLAIHGGELSTETAISVVRVGTEIIHYLRVRSAGPTT